MWTGVAGDDVVLCRKGIAQCIADQRVVINDEEQWLVRQRYVQLFEKYFTQL